MSCDVDIVMLSEFVIVRVLHVIALHVLHSTFVTFLTCEAVLCLVLSVGVVIFPNLLEGGRKRF